MACCSGGTVGLLAFAIPILVIGAAFEEKATAVLLHLNGSRLITKTTWQHVPVLVGIASHRAPLDWPTLYAGYLGSSFFDRMVPRIGNSFSSAGRPPSTRYRWHLY